MFSKFGLTNFLIVSLAALAFVEGSAAQSGNLTATAERTTGDRYTVSGRTPRGANIFAVNRPSTAMVNAIDAGLTDLFAIARKHGYRNKLQYSDYTIFIARPDRQVDAAGNYSPDFAIGAAQYAGTAYDKGGYIYAAGMVLATNPCAFVIADHTRDLQRVSNVVRYEGEHLVLYYNDRNLYQQTADHSRGGGHPLLQ